MFIYIVPIIVFLVMSIGIYYLKNGQTEKKEDTNVVFILIPSLVVSVLVYVFIKYKDHMFNSEPMMGGNFFDTPVTV